MPAAAVQTIPQANAQVGLALQGGRPGSPGSRSSRHEKLAQLIAGIQSATRFDTIFIDLKRDMLTLFDAEQMTFYAADQDRQQIYSRFLDVDTVKEIRVSINSTSVAGYVARTRTRVNIADAYDRAELARIQPDLTFDTSWDKRTGFRTRQMLVVPVVHEKKYLMGVIQILNKRHAVRFTNTDEQDAEEIAAALGSAFYTLHRFTRRRPGKFDYLLIQDLLKAEELNDAILEARRHQTDVESILLSKYDIQKEDLGVALCVFYQCQFVEFSDKRVIDPVLLADLRLDYLKFNFWVPLARRGSIIDVLIDNPHDVHKVDSVKRMFAGAEVNFCVGLRQDILRYIDLAAGRNESGSSVSSILGELVDEASSKDEQADRDDADLNDSAVVRLAAQLIVDGYRAGASDIHIEPRGPRADTLVRFRVDGECIEHERVPAALRRALVARLKIMGRLDIAERRKPQDGKILFRIDEKEVGLRIATFPSAGGNEDVSLRFVGSHAPLDIEQLRLTERNLREIKKIVQKPYGLILCVGPTGSGKTTTLHALLRLINTPQRRILTAEDPVEITQEGLRQVQVQAKIGFTFAAALRAFLRADPDVIMIGEMRDRETAMTAVEASLTGHLVLSTLHTNSAPETVIRLLDMGIDSFTFADSLLGILAQRLVKCLCSDCKEAYHPTVDLYEDLVNTYGGKEFEGLGVTCDSSFVLHRSRGCTTCNQTGYKGRAGLHELLIASDEIKAGIQRRGRVTEIFEQARAEGMTTLVQDGVLKSLQGLTDLQQVRAVAIK